MITCRRNVASTACRYPTTASMRSSGCRAASESTFPKRPPSTHAAATTRRRWRCPNCSTSWSGGWPESVRRTKERELMTALPLKIGVSDSDRTRPIASGEVAIAGAKAEVTLMGVQALFNQQLTEHTFDCCEFPIASYLRSMERPDRQYVAVPVFPSRHFRLSSVFVNTTKGVRTPADLAGKRIGVPVFDMAAAVWLRGIFQDHFGLPRTAPIYVAGGLEAARTGDEHPQFYPERFTHEQRGDKSLAVLLAEGEIDALYTARAPSTWPSPTVGRLFDQPIEAELDYFLKTGIFP